MCFVSTCNFACQETHIFLTLFSIILENMLSQNSRVPADILLSQAFGVDIGFDSSILSTLGQHLNRISSAT